MMMVNMGEIVLNIFNPFRQSKFMVLRKLGTLLSIIVWIPVSIIAFITLPFRKEDGLFMKIFSKIVIRGVILVSAIRTNDYQGAREMWKMV